MLHSSTKTLDNWMLQAIQQASMKHGQHKTWIGHLFNQVWTNTACGYGGIAGQALTTALTFVMEFPDGAEIYIAGQLAYSMDFKFPEVKFIYDQFLIDRKFPGQADIMKRGLKLGNDY